MTTTRDMTRAQFMAALTRNGFNKPIMMWATHRDLPHISFSMVFYRAGKIARRATIAHLIKQRDKELAKAERVS